MTYMIKMEPAMENRISDLLTAAKVLAHRDGNALLIYLIEMALIETQSTARAEVAVKATKIQVLENRTGSALRNGRLKTTSAH